MKNILIFLLPLICAAAFAADQPAIPRSHTTQQIEGWSVRVDDRLLCGEGAALGERALKLLAARLVAISIVVPESALAKLRAVTIQLDLNHGDLRIMQYHPNHGWLKAHGYSEALAKCVHIPDAEQFLSPFENHRMPWVVLHELSHAYHDQVLGFDEPRIRAAWEKFRDSGKYKSVLTSPGAMREHYALNDPKEFFAEMTESYFGSNDFYPFVSGELREAEPELFLLLSEIWGPLPGRAKPKNDADALMQSGLVQREDQTKATDLRSKARVPAALESLSPKRWPVQILSAIYGTGGKNADVTARVKEYVEIAKRTFSANPRELGADPNPTWNKSLHIVYMKEGVRREQRRNENETVLPESFYGPQDPAELRTWLTGSRWVGEQPEIQFHADGTFTSPGAGGTRQWQTLSANKLRLSFEDSRVVEFIFDYTWSSFSEIGNGKHVYHQRK